MTRSPSWCLPAKAFSRLAAARAALAFIAFTCASFPARATVVSYSKDTTTSVTTIDTTPGYTYYVLYSVGPLTVQAGDVVSVHFQQELTYSGTDAVMIAGGVLVGTSPTATTSSSSGYLGYASQFAGTNCTPDEAGVEVMSRTGSYKFTAAANNIYINAVVYGANLSGNPPGAVDVTVPAGAYGELVAVVERGVTRYETTTQRLPYDSTEGKYYIPVGGTQYVQLSNGPINIAANTMVDCRFEIEATTPPAMPGGSSNQRLGRRVKAATSSSDIGGTEIVRAMQAGITHGEHHCTVSHAGGLFYGSAASNVYFNSVLYAYGWNGVPKLWIEQPGATLYGHFVVETRPSAAGRFLEDTSRNITAIDATPRVLYSVGPIDVAADDVLEVRYEAAYQPSAQVTVVSKIIRATSATATTGVTVQPTLARVFHPNYLYGNMVQSTAEQVSAAATGQYYNVVVWRTSGASSCPVVDWGELEVVKR